MREYISIGKIIGVHGIKGETKVVPLTDGVRRFSRVKKCYLLKPDEKTLVCELNVISSRNDRGNVLMLFENYEDRTEAEKLKGLFVAVKHEDAVKPPKDGYLIADLKGCQVFDETLGSLGVVEDVFETGANFIVSVRRSGKENLLIPFLKAIFKDVDIDNSKIMVVLPEGLYEIYEPVEK